jgi:hypothetical protein
VGNDGEIADQLHQVVRLHRRIEGRAQDIDLRREGMAARPKP